MTSSKSPYNPAPAGEKLHRFVFGWLPLILATGAVIQGAMVPGANIPRFLDRFNDKFLHAGEFFVLTSISANTFLKSGAQFLRKYFSAIALIYTNAIGILTERLQIHVPGRSCDVKDWLADTAGSILCLMVYSLILSKRKKREVRG